MEYRGYRIGRNPESNMKMITTIGRGSLPNSLRGDFTSTYMACKAIDIAIGFKESKNGEVQINN